MTTLNIAGIIGESVVDGPGIRLVVFAQGCKHACPGCFNQELQSFRACQEMTVDQLEQVLLKYPHVCGVTLSGGDPFEQAPAFAQFAKVCKRHKKKVWAYTGYTFEALCTCLDKWKLLAEVDVLVDGPFVETLKDGSLNFRGSSNQRIISVQESIRQGQVILWNP